MLLTKLTECIAQMLIHVELGTFLLLLLIVHLVYISYSIQVSVLALWEGWWMVHKFSSYN